MWVSGRRGKLFAGESTVEADLELKVSVDVNTPFVGEVVRLLITLSNHGPNVATKIIVRDSLPAGLAYLGHEGRGEYDRVTGFWRLPILGMGERVTLEIPG